MENRDMPARTKQNELCTPQKSIVGESSERTSALNVIHGILLANEQANMSRVLITGGAGSIGSELVRQLSKEHEVLVFDINETGLHDLQQELGVKVRVGDVRDMDLVDSVVEDFAPETIYHAAAYKHVPLMEQFPREAVKTNILGTLNIIYAALKHDAKNLVFISTDKAVQSTSLMGATKRVSEIVVRNSGFTVVRFGNVLGSRGSLIPIWEKQAAQGKKLTVTDPKMERYMMTIEEACSLVIEAGKREPATYILDMGKPVNILELAKKMAKELSTDVEIIGMRPGEVLFEKLMTEEEERRALKEDKFFVIK